MVPSAFRGDKSILPVVYTSSQTDGSVFLVRHRILRLVFSAIGLNESNTFSGIACFSLKFFQVSINQTIVSMRVSDLESL